MVQLIHKAAAEGFALAFTTRLLEAFPGKPKQSLTQNLPDRDALSERELSVLKLMARCMSDKEIAKELSLSVTTIKRHVRNIYGKLGVYGRRLWRLRNSTITFARRNKAVPLKICPIPIPEIVAQIDISVKFQIKSLPTCVFNSCLATIKNICPGGMCAASL